jgi:RNA polymerase sigma-70 factor (ECF subfamily)
MLISSSSTMEPMMFENAPTKPSATSNSDAPCAAGNGSSSLDITALFEAEESALLNFAIGIVGKRTVAEELVQEAFLRLHKVWPQIENPRGWIYRSLRNLALNHLRDRKPESPLDEDVAAADESLPRELLGRNEAIGTVRMLLADLPEEDRNLIRLKYQEDLKYQEISTRTGLSVGNVGFRLHRLMKGLLDGLHRAGIEGSQG